MRLDAETIEGYFVAAAEREADLREIDRVITETAPELQRRLFAGPSITMVGYGEMGWERGSRSGAWPLIGMAAQKHHIALYVAATKGTETLAHHYQERLGKTQNGKHCIRFRRLADVDAGELANAVRDAVTWAAEMEVTFGRDCAAPEA